MRAIERYWRSLGQTDHVEVELPALAVGDHRLVGEDGLVEIKCPNSATHLDTLLSKKIPGNYVTQMQWQMAVTGRKWCDFVSFDPRLPPAMRLHIRRVERDDELLAQLEGAVTEFLAEVADTVSRLEARYMKEAA